MMPDREKVIKGLEMCLADELCDGCPYEENCFDTDIDNPWGTYVMRDALALLKEQEHKDRMYHALEDDWKRLKELLKEQEAVKPTWGRGKPFCGACGLRIRGGKFCSECGKPIAWEGR
jgi:hypothetical protein